MTKRKRTNRRKSSGSDSENQTSKQCKHHEQLNSSLSDAISEANSVLYNTLESDDQQQSSVQKAETLKIPEHKQSKITMATSETKDDSLKELKDQMKLVLSTVTEIKSNQEGMRRSFDSKLDKMRNEFMTTLDGKMRTLRDEISLDISRESGRIDELITSLQSLQIRLEAVEQSGKQDSANSDRRPRRANQCDLDDPELCITVSGLTYCENENLIEKANDLMCALGDRISQGVAVTGAIRLKPRFTGKPGLVKISFQTVEEKVCILRNKRNLKDTVNYKNVYIKSSRSHAERLIELNARTLLRQIPQGNNFWVDSNGRIRERTGQDSTNSNK